MRGLFAMAPVAFSWTSMMQQHRRIVNTCAGRRGLQKQYPLVRFASLNMADAVCPARQQLWTDILRCKYLQPSELQKKIPCAKRLEAPDQDHIDPVGLLNYQM